jgi:glyoxylase-like metal-dependent hydrolase (beta-lactamase superfamily II)
MKLTFVLLSALYVAASWALSAAPLRAQEEGPVEKINAEAANATISVTPLRGGLSMLSGSGGNITVLDGKDGKLLVDAGIAVSRKRIAEALHSTGNGPVKFLIDTHYHWDHTDGNAWVHGIGATIDTDSDVWVYFQEPNVLATGTPSGTVSTRSSTTRMAEALTE